jgi:hypothetical protein
MEGIMNIADIWQTWLKVVTHPEEATFEEERIKPNATLGTALIYIVIAAVIAAIFSFIGSSLMMPTQMDMVRQMLEQAELPPELKAQFGEWLTAGAMTGLAGAASVFSIIWAPIGFLIGVGLLYLFARMLGGNGEFGNYAYLLAVAQAPLTILQAILGLIPFMGPCLVLVTTIYGLVLAYYATKVAHNLSSGRAITVLVLPVVIIIALALCCVLAFVIPTAMNAGR